MNHRFWGPLLVRALAASVLFGISPEIRCEDQSDAPPGVQSDIDSGLSVQLQTHAVSWRENAPLPLTVTVSHRGPGVLDGRLELGFTDGRKPVNYGAVRAVRGISFDIPRGEVFGFIGPNGAGKSTTIKVLATLIRPDFGRVTIGGNNVVGAEQHVRERIGYMPDFFGVYEDMTAREYLHFFAAAYRIPVARRRELVLSVLELTDLTGKIDAPVDALSRGMKQRLGLARVLLHDPDLILLDEPASGLDPRARIEIRELLKELRSMGKTILISSHILSELAQLCTRIGIVEAGKMVAHGSIEEIYEKLDLQRIVHVQITNPSELLLGRIEALLGVTRVEAEGDRIAVHVREGEIAVEDLLTRILSLGGKVRMFQPEVMDMETAFMRLTEGKLS